MTHPNLPIHSRPRNAYPGDKVRIMQGQHTDGDGTEYDGGTEYMPISSGTDNRTRTNATYQDVTIGGRLVRFYRMGTANVA